MKFCAGYRFTSPQHHIVHYLVLVPVLTKNFAVPTATNEVLSNADLKFKNSIMCRLVKWYADFSEDRYSVLVLVLKKIFAILTGTNEVLLNGIFEI